MATIDTIKTILEENLDIDPSTVEESSTFDSLGIDSLDMVEPADRRAFACPGRIGPAENLTRAPPWPRWRPRSGRRCRTSSDHTRPPGSRRR